MAGIKGPESSREGGISRRDLMKRGAIVGGMVWAAPVMQSLSAPVHAQSSPLCSVCLATTFDPDGPGGQPPQQGHVTFDPTPACCACVAAGGGGVSAVILCAIQGACVPGAPEPGPCP